MFSKIKEAKDRIKRKTKAPNFTFPDSKGIKIDLSGFIGNNMILYFYPKDNTKGCTLEATDFRDIFEKIKEFNTVVPGLSRIT